MLLHTMQDDFELNANGDTERGEAIDYLSGAYNLIDRSGNLLVDRSGNYLCFNQTDNIRPQIIHAIQDDFILNAE